MRTRAGLERAGHRHQRTLPYGLATTSTGLELTPMVRARTGLRSLTPTDGPASAEPVRTRRWPRVEGVAHGSVHRRARPCDLALGTSSSGRRARTSRSAFPDLGGADAARYRQWLDDDRVAQQIQREIRCCVARPHHDHSGTARGPLEGGTSSDTSRPNSAWAKRPAGWACIALCRSGDRVGDRPDGDLAGAARRPT